MKKGFYVFGTPERVVTITIAFLLLVVAVLSWQTAVLAGIVVIGLYLYNRKSLMNNMRLWESYADRTMQSVLQLSYYALQNMPTAIVLIDNKGRINWSNSVFGDWMPRTTGEKKRLSELIPELRTDKIWGKTGVFQTKIEGRYYRVAYKYIEFEEGAVFSEDGEDGSSHKPAGEAYMGFFFDDVSVSETARLEAEAAVPAFCFLQLDNLEDVSKGLSDVEYTNLWAEVNNVIVEEMSKYDGFIRNYTDDSYLAAISRKALDSMIADNFSILNRVHNIQGGTHRTPVTLSIGIATAEPTMREQAEKARAGLDLALGRGGDQAAVYIGSEVKFYGGRTQGAEKNTRVRARVVSHAIKELMADADRVLVMGHAREDYDSIGGALGVAAMARMLGKPVHLAVSAQAQAVRKLTKRIREDEALATLLITPQEAEAWVTDETLVFVVDVHRPEMVAAPAALEKSVKRVVIDHHRRSSDFIDQPLLIYLEPASSSAGELVTELIQYFETDVDLLRVEATALYAGIVVDTKSFTVQTGARTFEAASYLKRNGADMDAVRFLFADSYDAMRVMAQMLASTLRENGLTFARCPEETEQASVVSSQVGDKLITIDGIEASFVFYRLPEDVVGVSARSKGDVNVQVIMEALGGGGHRTVAGAQLKDMSMDEAEDAVREVAIAALAELKKEEEI